MNINHVMMFLVPIIVIVSILYSYSTLYTGITGMATSQVGNLTVGVTTYISCVWSDAALDVSFGTNLDPGTNDISATNNSVGDENNTLYNVTVDVFSNVNGNITIKGANLVSGANTISVGNVTWASNTTDANGTNMVAGNSIALTTSYDTANPIAADEPIGSTVWYRFWLDIPSGTISGNYVGNYTMQCQQA